MGCILDRVWGPGPPPSDSLTSCRASLRPWSCRFWAAGGGSCSPPALSPLWQRKPPGCTPSSCSVAGGTRIPPCSRCWAWARVLGAEPLPGPCSPSSSSLQALLNAAPLFSPCDVQAVAFGLCSAQPHRAQLLLQEAVEKRKACTKQSSSSLVLVLDKVRALPCITSSWLCCLPAAQTFLLLSQHLQKLPWESMGCLKAVPITRLPSLRFLLSYSLAQKVRGCGGGIPHSPALGWGGSPKPCP